MANPTTTIAFPLIIAIAAAILAPTTAESPAPSPALDCFPYLLNLSDCVSFVQSGSNLTKPEPGCCPELSKLVDTQPICLCQLLGNSGQIGIAIDLKKAMELPSVCNVTTPPVSMCAASGYPVSDLPPSEAPSPAAADAATPPPPGGDKASATILASNHYFLFGFTSLFFTYFLS